MKKLEGKLPLLAFVVAAFAAVAFTSPKDLDPEYAQDPTNPAIWYDLSNETPGDDTYRCNLQVTDVCTRSLPDDMAPAKKNGEFVINGELEEVE
ncbi:hypothetical protein SAMN04489724_3004 [Algoriphagus locisalis]|uniref:Uncharacterized protein n=1 Tax=Algoriphagus locisalis TaxID=305507 RepID=A0A1I7CA56_9BACT|nr:hypothetical protein [Algoriphagus locisalis]SFT96309.1 hypothetical protein SAMN04489724_3004 [Algoriphagus locisalis]